MNSIDVNNLIRQAKEGDSASRNDLVEINRGFIRRVSSYICKRNLNWSNDDELSIALMAFNEAIDSFDIDRGMEFFSYCRMVIKRRLIDFFRKNSTPWVSLSAVDEDELSLFESKEAIDRYSISNAAEERATEIRMFASELSDYGLSMADLTSNSPKHKDTRKTLFRISLLCSKNRGILAYLKKNKMLPIKDIIEIANVKRKLIEQWRRYLVALLIIVSSDEYMYLKEYINIDEDECEAVV